jgi:hypothetical protein
MPSAAGTAANATSVGRMESNLKAADPDARLLRIEVVG